MNTSTSSENPLARERRYVTGTLAFLVLAILSGIVTHLAPGHPFWEQWTYLLHSLSGIILGLVLLPHTWQHLRRTLGQRRPAMLLSGISLLVLLFSLSASGIYILFFGISEPLRWIYDWHLILGYVTAVGLVLHLLLHLAVIGHRGRKLGMPVFLTLTGATGWAVLLTLGLGLILLGSGLAVQGHTIPTYTSEPVTNPYQYLYGEHPFRPSQTETATGSFVDPRQIAGSDACGTCHEQIYREWSASIHSQAASDPTYVTNINLLAENKGLAATRYCEGCHAPVALLTGQLSQGGEHAGKAGTLANHEGVGCLGCHGINRAIHTKGVASYEFAPGEGYLFADSASPLGRALHNLLIRIQPQLHRAEMARPVLAAPALCATCHSQFMDKDVNDWGWVKMQDEYSAWLMSPYSGQSQQSFRESTAQRCQDCHFPLRPGIDPSANGRGLVRSHRTLGANTAIPAVTDNLEQFHLTKEFLQANRMHVSIDPPWRAEASRSAKFVGQGARSVTETPAYLYLGEDATLSVTVTNTGVGHDFPGGTSDINEAWIDLTVMDGEGREVYQSGGLEPDGDVDGQAHFYRSIPVDRRGQPVWKHDLFNMVGDNYKKVVPAGGADVVEYDFQVPHWAKSPLTVSAVLRYRKLNNRYARWALQDDRIELPIVDMARNAIIIPLRTRPDLDNTGTVPSHVNRS